MTKFLEPEEMEELEGWADRCQKAFSDLTRAIDRHDDIETIERLGEVFREISAEFVVPKSG